MADDNFKIGDIVRYREDSHLVDPFLKHWGRGPFVVCVSRGSLGLELNTIDGRIVSRVEIDCPNVPWTCTENGLELDPFLTAVKEEGELRDKRNICTNKS